MRQLPASELLVQMPFLQKLLQRLLDCKPTGAASHDTVVQVPTETGDLGSEGPAGGGERARIGRTVNRQRTHGIWHAFFSLQKFFRTVNLAVKCVPSSSVVKMDAEMYCWT